MLTLNENPQFEKRVKLTSDEKREAFSEFYEKANAFHKARQVGRKKSDIEQLHWKDELYASINPKDHNRYAEGVAFVCGSELEVVEIINARKHIVCASGYWNNIGS